MIAKAREWLAEWRLRRLIHRHAAWSAATLSSIAETNPVLAQRTYRQTIAMLREEPWPETWEQERRRWEEGVRLIESALDFETRRLRLQP